MKKRFKITSSFAALGVLLPLTTLVRADVIYSEEDFEGEPTGTLSTTANGTDYVLTSTSGDKAEVAGNLVSNPSPGAGSDPSGQHGLVRGDANKHMTLADPMPLASDGVTSLQISLAVYFNNTGNNNRLRLWYSALGDFSDQVQIQVFNPTGVVDLPNFEYEEDRWYAGQGATIDSADAAITFTDTAKIRWAKIGTGQANRVYFDDVVITGIGGAAALPFAITEIEYEPGATPDPTVTLTWRKAGVASYIAYLSRDLSDWGEDLDDSILPVRDEKPADAEHMTVTFPLEGDRADAEELFFRIEEGS